MPKFQVKILFYLLQVIFTPDESEAVMPQMTAASNVLHIRTMANAMKHGYMQMMTEIILMCTKQWTVSRIIGKSKSPIQFRPKKLEELWIP